MEENLKSKYLENLEDFYKAAKDIQLLPGSASRLSKFTLFIKAFYVYSQLDGLFNRLNSGELDIDDFGINYEEWAKNIWDLDPSTTAINEDIDTNNFIDTIGDYCYEYDLKYNRTSTVKKFITDDKDANLQLTNKKKTEDELLEDKKQDIIEERIKKDNLKSGIKALLSQNNISDDFINVTLKSQFRDISDKLNQIKEIRDKQKQTKSLNNIEDKKFIALFDQFYIKEGSWNYKNLNSHFTKIRENDYPDNLLVAHYKMMLKPYLQMLIEDDIICKGANNQIVSKASKNNYIQDLYITDDDYILDINNQLVIKKYQRLRELLDYKGNLYIINKVEFGKLIYRHRDSMGPNRRKEIFESLAMIEIIQKDMRNLDDFYCAKNVNNDAANNEEVDAQHLFMENKTEDWLKKNNKVLVVSRKKELYTFELLFEFIYDNFVICCANDYEWFALLKFLKDEGYCNSKCDVSKFITQMNVWFDGAPQKSALSETNRYSFLNIHNVEDWCGLDKKYLDSNGKINKRAIGNIHQVYTRLKKKHDDLQTM